MSVAMTSAWGFLAGLPIGAAVIAIATEGNEEIAANTTVAVNRPPSTALALCTPQATRLSPIARPRGTRFAAASNTAPPAIR